MFAASTKNKNSKLSAVGNNCGIFVLKFNAVTKFPPIKSLPSLGPTFPDSNPLNLLEGINNLSDNLISSFVNEFAVFINIPAVLIISLVSILTAPIGVEWAHNLEENKLKRLFGLYLLFVSSGMFWKASLSSSII